jgi:hypothetical protein
LFPMTDSISKVSVASNTTSTAKVAKVLVDSISLVVVPPAPINSLIEDWNISKVNKMTTIVAPYWWVAGVPASDKNDKTEGGSKINMKFQNEDGEGKVVVQCLINTRAIKVHDQLMFADPAKAIVQKKTK